jgi:hypothetical protein
MLEHRRAPRGVLATQNEPTLMTRTLSGEEEGRTLAGAELFVARLPPTAKLPLWLIDPGAKGLSEDRVNRAPGVTDHSKLREAPRCKRM